MIDVDIDRNFQMCLDFLSALGFLPIKLPKFLIVALSFYRLLVIMFDHEQIIFLFGHFWTVEQYFILVSIENKEKNFNKNLGNFELS